MTALPHITICICTYKRPHFLARLLEALQRQETGGLFTYSIVVADNDAAESAKSVVEAFCSTSPIELVYCVERRQNIALTRNLAVGHATGDFIAFIDDDEFPIEDWLLILFKTCRHYGVDGVLGPVKPYFEVQPPEWVVKGKFYDRPSYMTGFKIDWTKGRTGNALLKRNMFLEGCQAFNPRFLTGEDQDFYRRMILDRGRVFIWCNEAVAYEVVPPARWNRWFILRRALLRGQLSLNHPTFGIIETAKSALAVSAYTFMMPFLMLMGQHVVMSYLEKAFAHLGKLSALLGIVPVKENYVTQ